MIILQMGKGDGEQSFGVGTPDTNPKGNNESKWGAVDLRLAMKPSAP